jgi:hypothetical protein
MVSFVAENPDFQPFRPALTGRFYITGDSESAKKANETELDR